MLGYRATSKLTTSKRSPGLHPAPASKTNSPSARAIISSANGSYPQEETASVSVVAASLRSSLDKKSKPSVAGQEFPHFWQTNSVSLLTSRPPQANDKFSEVLNAGQRKIGSMRSNLSERAVRKLSSACNDGETRAGVINFWPSTTNSIFQSVLTRSLVTGINPVKPTTWRLGNPLSTSDLSIKPRFICCLSTTSATPSITQFFGNATHPRIRTE